MGQTQPNGRLPDAPGGRAAGGLAARPALKRFARNVSGATAVEYGLIVSLIFLVILGAVTTFGSKSTGMYNAISTAVSSAM